MNVEKIKRKKRTHCLGLLRDARALILRDAESFHDATTILEQVGQIVGGSIRIGLGGYRDSLLELAESAGRCERAEISRLLKVVCDARNMAVHEGAWARHLSSRLIDLLLILEEAIMVNSQLVEDLMVRNPLVAESWHMISHVRREMLANSFSSLPMLHEDKWQIISDVEVMRFIQKSLRRDSKEAQKEKLNRLSMDLATGIEKGAIKPIDAVCCSPKDTIADIHQKMEASPILVTEDNRLVGILTAFDLL